MSNPEILLPVYVRTARDVLTRALASIELHGVEAATDDLIRAVSVANQIPHILSEIATEEVAS